DFCTVNNIYSQKLLNEIACEKKETSILPVGVSMNRFNPAQKPVSDQLEILFTGRLIRLKAPDMVIDIMHQLIQAGFDNVHCTIVGEGPLQAKLGLMIEQYNLMEKVFLVGAKTQEEMIPYYLKADLFLFPGIHDPKNGRCETQGLVVQEAQAMEVPVVISDVGGIKHGMIDGLTGVVVHEGDINGFVDALKRLILDPGLRQKMGKAGRRFVSKNFEMRILGR